MDDKVKGLDDTESYFGFKYEGFSLIQYAVTWSIITVSHGEGMKIDQSSIR